MAYLVKITKRAERDLDLLYDVLRVEEHEAALRWYRRLKAAILSLERNPLRCPATPEDQRLLHLLFGKKPHVYRVIYRVQPKAKIVEVLHIRHGAMKDFSPSQLASE